MRDQQQACSTGVEACNQRVHSKVRIAGVITFLEIRPATIEVILPLLNRVTREKRFR